MDDMINNNPENTIEQEESKIEEQIITENMDNDQEQMISQEFLSNQVEQEQQQIVQSEEQHMNEHQFVTQIIEENNMQKIEEQNEQILEAETHNKIETETNINIMNEQIADNNRMEEVVEQENNAVIMNQSSEQNNQSEVINQQTEQQVISQQIDEQMDHIESNVMIENIEHKVEEKNQINLQENQEKITINENAAVMNKQQTQPEDIQESKETELKIESQPIEQDLESAMVRDIMSSTQTNTTSMDIIDTSDLKPATEQKDLNQLVDSLINDVCNPDASNRDEEDEISKLNDSSNTDAVADVVAAVEAAAKSNPSGTTSTATPKSAKKKKSNPSPSKPTISNHLNNSLSQNDTSPLSSNQKRRKKDPYAPKAPLNGYLVYFNEERAEMRSKNPNMSFGELTKIIATKWKELPNEDKQKYINEADIDKERYVKEMADYKKSDAYKQFLKENAQSKYLRQDEASQSHADSCFNRVPGTSQPNMNWLQGESNVAGFDIPIFTEEFIEHSRNREQEMRALRKELNELEQQNGVLNKHIDNLKQSTNKIEQDIEHYKNSNNQLQKNLDLFRQTVLHCFNNIPLPNTQDYPTPANIDEYIMRLYNIVNIINQNENNPNNMNDQFYVNNRSFALHVKSVFSKINFNSLFECV
jgi:hypothetical protein